MTFHLLFSHRLTPEQEADARASLGATELRYLPEALQAQWSQLDPEPESLDAQAQPFEAYLSEATNPGDYLLIQGDFGMTHRLVLRAQALGRIPVYATTRRESQEITAPDGSIKKTLTFKHVRFRRY
jgi:hypothetical protein